MFDGRSLDAWRNYGKASIDERWMIDDGAMLMSKKGAGDLISRGAWENFELTLEWKVARGGNSGIFLLADESDLPIFVHAPEIQILDNERHPDRKIRLAAVGSGRNYSSTGSAAR